MAVVTSAMEPPPPPPPPAPAAESRSARWIVTSLIVSYTCVRFLPRLPRPVPQCPSSDDVPRSVPVCVRARAVCANLSRPFKCRVGFLAEDTRPQRPRPCPRTAGYTSECSGWLPTPLAGFFWVAALLAVFTLNMRHLCVSEGVWQCVGGGGRADAAFFWVVVLVGCPPPLLPATAGALAYVFVRAARGCARTSPLCIVSPCGCAWLPASAGDVAHAVLKGA